ncbi:MAG: hypothetical protein HWN80_12095 [Candidatus Lokiarchaeota archaeon]|nr:hypothetical protein [Candidatus Lokiarchaeota archaeon]
MAEDLFVHGLQNIGYLLNVIVIPLATIIVGRKLLKEKKATGKLNDIRAIIFFIFFSFSNLVILEFLIGTQFYDVATRAFLSGLFGGSVNEFNLYSLVIGIIASLGLMMVAVANRWDFLQYSSLFFFGGMILLYVFTGFGGLLESYIYFAGAASIFFLYLTAFRVKDNGALALAIFFTIAFGTVIFDVALITGFGVILYNIVILIFSFGWFKPFKQEVVA